MGTLLNRLRKESAAEAKAHENAVVDDLTAGGNSPRGKFAAGCDRARAATGAAELYKAKQEMLANPSIVDTPRGVGDFYSAYPHADSAELRGLVARVSALRHPRGTASKADENELRELLREPR